MKVLARHDTDPRRVIAALSDPRTQEVFLVAAVVLALGVIVMALIIRRDAREIPGGLGALKAQAEARALVTPAQCARMREILTEEFSSLPPDVRRRCPRATLDARPAQHVHAEFYQGQQAIALGLYLGHRILIFADVVARAYPSTWELETRAVFRHEVAHALGMTHEQMAGLYPEFRRAVAAEGRRA